MRRSAFDTRSHPTNVLPQPMKRLFHRKDFCFHLYLFSLLLIWPSLTSLVIENFISGLYLFLRKILAGMAKKFTGHRGRAFAEAMPSKTQSVTQPTAAAYMML
jgi:hypothetical protein